MTRIAVTGYASLDHVVQLNGPPRPNRTALIAARDAGAWPRLGGSPAYIVPALRRAGHDDATLITWVGRDAEGERYLRLLAAAGLPTGGVSRALNGPTPVCILAYDPAGDCYCLYEAGAGRGISFDARQRQLVTSAAWVCVAAQQATATRDVLSRLSPEQTLVWAVKADADAFPPDVRRDLAARADLIVHSRSERPFVEPALAEAGSGRTGRILVETRGPEGAQVTAFGQTTQVATERVVVSDPTGAGDTFLGGLIGALITAPGDPVGAVRSGDRAARAMLAARASRTAKGVEA
jgi:ribokinase